MKAIEKSAYIAADTNILPPNGYQRQVLFKLGKEIKIPALEVTDFNYQLDITTSTGEGTITVAHSKKLYENLKTYGEFELYWGWSEKGNLKPVDPDVFKGVSKKSKAAGRDALEQSSKYTDELPLILTGFIKEVKQNANKLVIGFYDRGILLEKEDIYESASWSRSALCADIITKAGLEYAFDWAGDPAYDETITFPPADTSADAAAGTTGVDANGNPTTVDANGNPTAIPGITNVNGTNVGTPNVATNFARKNIQIGNATINLFVPNNNQSTSATSSASAGIIGGVTVPTDVAEQVKSAVEATGQTIPPASGAASTAPQQHDSEAIQGSTYSADVVCMPGVNGECGRCGWEKGQPTCFVNKCPHCGKNTLRPSTKFNGQFKDTINCNKYGQNPAGGCDADYCGKCGLEEDNAHSTQLTIASDAQGGATQAQKGETYWELLTKAIEPTKNDLAMFVLLNTVYILKIPSPNNPAVYADDTKNMSKDTISITDPKPDAVNTVIVSYGKGAKPKTVKSSFPEMVKKYGKKEQKFTEAGLSKEAAQNFADTKLRMFNRTDGMKIDLTVVGTPFFTPHNWCRVKSTKYDIDDVFYITRYNLQFSAGKVPTAGLSLGEYYPDLTILNADDKTGILNGDGLGSGTPAAMKAIVEKEATFKDIQGRNGDGVQESYMNHFIRTGHGDCWADAYWVYDQLTKAGFKARIACGNGGCKCSGDGHRFVQYWNGSAWVNFPYAKNSQGGVKGRTVDGILKKPWDHEGSGC